MSEQDAVRARRQHLLFKMQKHGMGHPNYHAWEAEYNDLRPQTSAPRVAASTKCEGPRGYPPVTAEQMRQWPKPEHVNPRQMRNKGGRL